MSNQLDIRIDVSRAKSGMVTALHGVTDNELLEIESRVLQAHERLLQEREQGKYGFYDLYKHDAVFSDIREKAARFSSFKYDNLVVLGIGGSALGITALNSALNPPYWNLLSRAARKGHPRLFVMDNIDPDTFKTMMRLCPPRKTLYNVISKSGETAETICQLLIIVEKLEKEVGAAAMKDHLVVTTSPKGPNAPKSLLHPVADAYD
ncbi:MAG TPA: glucose-6-phosphate isomerase, partial [Candidatus Hydrogenedentes bacterium]|nr:glucose-6-phosphate isomerase [Candidatus Hydrogenedentota bacterium]